MPAFEVSRTLVKSAPEVWSELEKTERLAELLGDGAITITRLKPETEIEWRGSTASGKIEIAASSWGTKVRLTADAEETVDPVAVITEAVAEPVAEPMQEPKPSAPVGEPEQRLEQRLDAEPTAKQSFWKNFMARFTSNDSPVAVIADEEEPAPVAAIDLVAKPEPPTDPEPENEPAAQAAATEPIDYEARLTAVLDHLGSAHKRPFSAA